MDRPLPAYDGDEPHVFVSYSHEDAEFVYPEIRWLQDQGFNVWWDEGISGATRWRDEIADRIRGCHLFLFYISPTSVDSQVCREELEYALDQGRPVLSSHVESTSLPQGIKLAIANRQALFRHELEPEDYERKLLSAVATYLEQPLPAIELSLRAPSRKPSRQVTLFLAVVCLLLLGGIVASVTWLTVRAGPPTPRPLTRFELSPPDQTFYDDMRGGSSGSSIAVAPDGRQLAFVALDGKEGTRALWVRSLDALAAQRLTATDGVTSPFWSPDSQSIAFFADGKLKRISARGGDVQIICDSQPGAGGTWNQDDIIVFSPAQDGEGGLAKVPAGGGARSPLTDLDAEAGETNYTFPWFLPGERQYLFFLGADDDKSGIYVGSLDSEVRTRLLDYDELNGQYSMPVFASGHLLFVRDRSVMAQSFDTDTLQLTGDAVRIVDRVATTGAGSSAFSVSANGVLAYWSGSMPAKRQLTWVGRDGGVIEQIGSPVALRQMTLGPAGRQLAMTQYAPEERAWTDAIWLMDIGRRATTKLTFDWGASNPVWSPDGGHLVFASPRMGPPNLYRRTIARRDEELLFKGSNSTLASGWSPDGNTLVFATNTKGTNWDLWLLPFDADQTPVPFLQTPFNELDGRVSPDGRWMAYMSDERGQFEVYVTNFPLARNKWRISTDGATLPEWRQDGEELYFRAADNTLMAVRVPAVDDWTSEEPQPLFELPSRQKSEYAGSRVYAPSSDGRRFLVGVPIGDEVSTPATVVLNWTAELQE